MPDKKTNSKLLLFYVLVAYIIFQFVWWEVLLVKQTREIHREKQKLSELASSNDSDLKKELETLGKQENYRIYMIVGEATVFLILISLGIVKVYRTYRRDTELAAQQRNFLLSITHELKSPLASTKLQLQTLQKRELDRNTQQQIIANALSDTERLNSLVENILMSTRLEGKNDLLQKEMLNLSVLVEETISRHLTPKIQRRLCLDIDPDIMMNVDKVAFPSIVINLIVNADKYTGDDSLVEISLKKGEKEVVLQVADKGPGIAEVERNKVFEKFYRVGNEETRNTKGTGLGLFIVKRLTEQHEGKISLHQNKPMGALFRLTFPHPSIITS